MQTSDSIQRLLYSAFFARTSHGLIRQQPTSGQYDLGETRHAGAKHAKNGIEVKSANADSP